MIDAKGAPYTVTSLGYDASPPLLKPQTQATFSVVLRGDMSLQSADLSSISVTSTAGALASQGDSTEKDGSEYKRTLSFGLAAPRALGPITITLRVPGLEAVKERVLVFGPN